MTQSAARRGTPMFSILDALADPNLLGAMAQFHDLSTWRAWLVFLRAVYGLALEGDDLGTFKRHTGRTVYAPPPGGYPEAAAIVGRQAGKSALAAALVSFEAASAARERGVFALLIAQDFRGAQRTLFNYAAEVFDEVPMFGKMVEGRTSETLSLRNGITIACYPCRPAAVRGLRARVAVVDELAFFTSTDGRPTDVEMLRALRPALATTGGKLVVLSSPYAQAGALWALHRRRARERTLASPGRVQLMSFRPVSRAP